MSGADRKHAWEMSEEEFDTAVRSADPDDMRELMDELEEGPPEIDHGVDHYGIDRRLVRTDSPRAAELREMDTITLTPGGHDPIELEFDEALQLLDEAAPLVLEMAEERTRLTVPEFCPMCECHDATPVPPKDVDDRDWTAVKHWLRDEFDIHITRKEVEHHYDEHVYHRNITPVAVAAGEGPTSRIMLPDGDVVEVPEVDSSPATRLRAMVEAAEEALDDSHLLDRRPTDVERDVVGALEFGETYTVSELADASGRPRQSVYNNVDGLVEARVLHRFGGSPARYEATGLCLYKGLEAPTPEIGDQSALRDWAPDPELTSLGEVL